MGFEEQPPDDTSKEYRNAEEPIEHHGSGEMYNVDPEKLAANDSTELPQLQRRLKSRHLQMIAIGKLHGTRWIRAFANKVQVAPLEPDSLSVAAQQLPTQDLSGLLLPTCLSARLSTP